MTHQGSLFGFRATLGALAALTGLIALWMITADLVIPHTFYFPANRSEADALSAVQGQAKTAAKIGVIRGDLWTIAAVSRGASLLFGAGAPPNEIENARRIAEHAARLSPHDPRNWLLLAGLEARLGVDNAKFAELLKLSYYTAPNEPSLMPLRLLLAVESYAIADDELQSLVAPDIERVLADHADLKPAIAQAYKNARPKGRELIETTVSKIDPDFLATFATPAPTQ
jgi:hypothetical protein